MAEPNAGPRYAAFISYSHRDEALAAWLHRTLEAYRTPRALIGRNGDHGPVPRRIGRCFRDRAELSAADDLAREIRQALDQSATLIVLCSPRSAGSSYVAEEIRYFKSLGRGQRILAAIADGEPHAAGKVIAGRTLTDADECFPGALLHRIGADGQISADREIAEVIAADFRRGKDERDAGKLKLIAALLGVGLDDLVQRERVAARRRARMLGAAALTFAGVAIAAGFFGYEANRQRIIAEAETARAEAQLAIANARRMAGEANLTLIRAADVRLSRAALEVNDWGGDVDTMPESRRLAERAALLSLESLNTAETLEGQQALRASLQALQNPEIMTMLSQSGELLGWNGNQLVFTPLSSQSVGYDVTTDAVGPAPVLRSGLFGWDGDESFAGAASADGRYRVSVADDDQTLTLTHVETGESFALAHEWFGAHAVFSKDGRWLTSVTPRVSMDAADAAAEALPGSTVRIWETQTGRLLFESSFAQVGGLLQTAISPDGAWIAISASAMYGRGGITLWPIAPDTARAEICRRSTRNLSQSEWDAYVRDRPYSETCPGLPAVED